MFFLLCEISEPRNRAIFYCRVKNRLFLIEVHKMKLHMKYQRSGSSGFRQKDFLKFLPI